MVCFNRPQNDHFLLGSSKRKLRYCIPINGDADPDTQLELDKYSLRAIEKLARTELLSRFVKISMSFLIGLSMTLSCLNRLLLLCSCCRSYHFLLQILLCIVWSAGNLKVLRYFFSSKVDHMRPSHHLHVSIEYAQTVREIAVSFGTLLHHPLMAFCTRFDQYH